MDIHGYWYPWKAKDFHWHGICGISTDFQWKPTAIQEYPWEIRGVVPCYLLISVDRYAIMHFHWYLLISTADVHRYRWVSMVIQRCPRTSLEIHWSVFRWSGEIRGIMWMRGMHEMHGIGGIRWICEMNQTPGALWWTTPQDRLDVW